ncbi:hypothetical protein CI610_03788 [invertebrate metagenome]|uniref:Uncharacterized protein n=1 Tax=invertebrate metagenome TaxID=1711999 RepID=A0A2H9T223_9ZZZZ
MVDRFLAFEDQISSQVKKANSMFAVIRRSFQFLNEHNFSLLYKTLVRVHLEYANTVWHPSNLNISI